MHLRTTNFCFLILLLQLLFHTINSSRSAYECIAFKPGFFDAYTVSGNSVQCSVLLKVRSGLFLTLN